MGENKTPDYNTGVIFRGNRNAKGIQKSGGNEL